MQQENTYQKENRGRAWVDCGWRLGNKWCGQNGSDRTGG